MLQEQKPKKPIRKKSKPSAMTRPPKRNKKKKKTPAVPIPPPAPISAPIVKHELQPPPPPPIEHIPSPLDIFHHDTILDSEPVQLMSKTATSLMSNHYLSDNSTIYHFTQADLANLQEQELFTVCENSSAYESSEDTGVGGLSESELMNASDGIGMWP